MSVADHVTLVVSTGKALQPRTMAWLMAEIAVDWIGGETAQHNSGDVRQLIAR